MSSNITAAGLTIPTLTELRQDIESGYQGVWGTSADLSPEGYMGQHIAIMSKRDRDAWELQQEILTARDPDTATGVSLDEISAETGVTRLAPTAASAAVTLFTQYGVSTTVPAGSKIKAATSQATYSSTGDVTGTASATGPFKVLRFKMKGSYAVGDYMRIAINGASSGGYYTVSGDTPASVAAHAAAAVATFPGALSATVLTLDGGVYLQVTAGTSDVVPELADCIGFDSTSTWQQGLPGYFVCDTVGARAVPPLSLDTIASPVSGWLSVYQPAQGTAGTDTESDSALRLRRLRQMRSGTGTEDAIYNALMHVDGVSRAIVASNRTNAPDSEGRPPHCLECVVVGGSDTDVARAIWQSAPGGVGFYGTFTELPDTRPIVAGADGHPKRVNFSRPQPVYAWVRVNVTAYDTEETLPSDVTAALKAAIVSWANENMGLGNNMNLKDLYTPINTVPGVAGVMLDHAMTTSESGTPSYGEGSIAITSRQYAVYSASRIAVVLS